MITKEQALVREKIEAGDSYVVEFVSCWENAEVGILVLVTDWWNPNSEYVSPNHVTRRFNVYGEEDSKTGGTLKHYEREETA